MLLGTSNSTTCYNFYMKKQVVVIHGGDTFDSYEEYILFLEEFEVDLEYLRKKGWKSSLQKELGEDFDVIAPQMPNKFNAKYSEWKLWFDKYVPLFNDEVVLVGHSQGGTFLSKYLSENKMSKKIKGVFLVAAPYDDETQYTLGDFKLKKSLEQFEEQAGEIFLYQSKDDPLVPFTDFEKYTKELPKAHVEVFESREHFNQEEFPEIVRDIKKVFT